MDCSLPDSSVLGDSPGKNPGVSCHFLLQGIFPTQGWNLHSPHCRQPLRSEPPGRLRGCGCMGREEDPSVISRRVLTDDTQWSEMFPSEALEETLGHAQGSVEPPMPARGPCLLGGGASRTGRARLGKHGVCSSPTCGGYGPRAGEASLPPSCSLLQTHLGSRPPTHTGLSKKQHLPWSWNAPGGQSRQESPRGKWPSGAKRKPQA